MVVRPLGLPQGSVRAVLLLSLAATAILHLRRDDAIQSWLLAALVVAAASYFSARSATNAARRGPDGEMPKQGHPLGLPAGWIRTLFLLAVGYGAWFWLSGDDQPELGRADARLAWVLLAFVVGVVSRFLLKLMRRPDDIGARFMDHLLALVSLLAGLGLVGDGRGRRARRGRLDVGRAAARRRRGALLRDAVMRSFRRAGQATVPRRPGGRFGRRNMSPSPTAGWHSAVGRPLRSWRRGCRPPGSSPGGRARPRARRTVGRAGSSSARCPLNTVRSKIPRS